MPVDKQVRLGDAGPHNRKKGLKGGAGGDVRGVNQLTAVASNSEHTYSNGGWTYADTQGSELYPPLGQTYIGPTMWISGGRYRKGDRVTDYVSGVPREYVAAVNIPAVSAADATAATTDSNTAGDVAPTTATACWTRLDGTYGLTKNQSGLNVGIPAAVAVANGATTGLVTVTWTQGKPTATVTYEVIALRPDLYWDYENSVPGNERTVDWIMQNTYSDSDDLTGLTDNGEDYPLPGSGWVLTTAAANSATKADWDVRSIVAAGYEVVVGVRCVTPAVALSSQVRGEIGRRGPWVWATGTSKG